MDRQTDRQTDGQTDIPPLAIPAVCIARYANALVKSHMVYRYHRHRQKFVLEGTLLLGAGTLLTPEWPP